MAESVMDAWVAEDGSYGSGVILSFDASLLTDTQWDRLTDISDADKIFYAQAIIEGNDFIVRKIEMDNFGEHWGLDG